MNRTKTAIVLVATLIVVSVPMLWQHREIIRLRQELSDAREATTRPDSAAATAMANQSPDEDTQHKREEMELEVLRLRGAQARAVRAEVEAARLKLQVERQSSQSAGDRSDTTAPVADALIAYLGSPVQAPANMEPAYTREGLLGAIQLAARNAGIALKKVQVDDSEFPFLLGVECEEGDFEKLKEQIKKMDGYAYNGSVGSHSLNAFSIVPGPAFPPGTGQIIRRRTMLREQAFFDKLQAQE